MADETQNSQPKPVIATKVSADPLPVLSLQAVGDAGTKALAQLPDKSLVRARQLAQAVNITDTSAVLQYGVSAQKKLTEFADTVLKDVRVRDAGQAGELLSSLKGKIEELDVTSLTRSPGVATARFVEWIPLVGPWLASKVSELRAFLRRYDRVKAQIDMIVGQLNSEKDKQLQNVTRLDVLHEKNEAYFQELDEVIAAGIMKLKDLEAEFGRRRAAVDPSDVLQLQKLQDFYELIQAFDRRIYNLQLARAAAVTSGPTLRITQNGAKSIVEFVQDSILVMVPEWKKQLLIAIALFDQQRALKMVQEARDTTNSLMLSNAEMLKQTQTQIKSMQGEGFVKVDTIQKVTANLIETLDKGVQMDVENRAKRAESLRQLEEAEEQLKAALRNVQASASA